MSKNDRVLARSTRGTTGPECSADVTLLTDTSVDVTPDGHLHRANLLKWADSTRSRELEAAVAAQAASDARADRRLTVLFYAVMIGLLAASIIGLAAGSPVVGVG